MKRTFALLALLGLAACNADIPSGTDSSVGPLFARGGGSQTLYAITLAGGLQDDPAHPFSALGVTGDPFSGKGISADPVYLTLPASAGGTDLAACDGDGSLGDSTPDWRGYEGVWKGSFVVAGKKPGNSSYRVAFGATREDGTGFLWLVIQSGTGVKSNNNLTLTFTNVRGLVSAGSTPVGGGEADAQDRCLTFSITATP
jgi:hypothetical protein